MSVQPDIQGIARQFQVEGKYVSAVPHGSGHINDTYAVAFSQAGSKKRYILQRINHHVFKNPLQLMENIVRVTHHIRDKLSVQEGVADHARRVLSVVPTNANAACHQDAEGNYWRVFNFIEGTNSHDVLDTPEQAYQVARAFSEFLIQLSDLPGSPLHEIIPDFHDGPVRYGQFRAALAADRRNRASTCQAEVEFLQAHVWVFDVVPQLIEQLQIPLRTTHNDTKVNNVLLDSQTGRGMCVIDLDTVMPGVSLYDFGDLVRTCCNRAAEDEPDLSKVEFLMPRYQALLCGYLGAAGELLNRCEREHMAFSGVLITLMAGTRFLTDYLEGDTYFQIHRPDHNLDRCRNQFKLVECIRNSEEQMNELSAFER